MSVKIIVKAIALVAALQLSGCANNSQSPDNRDYLTSTAEITENIDFFLEKYVTVRNDVIETIGNRGLILDRDRLLSNETLLVINTTETRFSFSSDRTPEILVRGTVDKLNLSRLQHEFNLDLDSSLYAQYEGKPTIIATSAILSPDPEDLSDRPKLYYDLPLAVKGEVEDIDRQHGLFELDEEKAFGGEDLLVLHTKPIELNEEQNVILYGVLRFFVANELERDYNPGWNSSTQKQLEAKYGQKPVFIAKKIQILR